MNALKKIIAVSLAASMIAASSVALAADTSSASDNTSAAQEIKFSDVDENTSSGKAIYKLAKAGIVSGHGDGTFKPNDNLTRAELCKMVNLVFGYKESAEDNFPDVDKEKDWFYPYVAVAKKAGYIAGNEDGTFRGNNNLTREETCVIITRVTKLYDLPYVREIKDEVSDWALPYVKKVLANRIMSLETGDVFRATSNITRAELAVVLSRFVSDEVVEPTTPTAPTTPTTPSTPSTGGNGNSTGGKGNGSTGGNGNSSKPSKPDTKPDPDPKPDPEPDPEPVIDEAQQKKAVDDLNALLKQLPNIMLPTAQQEIVDEIVKTIEKTLKDAENGTAIYETGYVRKTYKDDIDRVCDMYDALQTLAEQNGVEKERYQNELQSSLYSGLDEDLSSELFQMFFGIDIKDYINSGK